MLTTVSAPEHSLPPELNPSGLSRHFPTSPAPRGCLPPHSFQGSRPHFPHPARWNVLSCVIPRFAQCLLPAPPFSSYCGPSPPHSEPFPILCIHPFASAQPSPPDRPLSYEYHCTRSSFPMKNLQTSQSSVRGLYLLFPGSSPRTMPRRRSRGPGRPSVSWMCPLQAFAQYIPLPERPASDLAHRKSHPPSHFQQRGRMDA